MSSGNKKTEKKISIAGKIKSAILKSIFGRDMRAPLAVLVASGFLLMIFVCIYLFKEIVANLPDVADPDNVIDLGTASGNTYADLEWSMSYTDYMREYGVNIAITQELTENEDGEIEVIEVIDLGDVGILGSSLNIDNFDDSEWTIDPDIQNASVIASGKPVHEPTYEDDGNPEPTPDVQTPTGEGPSVKEYVTAANSCQALNYIIYKPENASSATPIFLYLHGIGENGAGYDRFISTYTFLKYLISGTWSPDVIIVSPILTGGSSWRDQAGNLSALLGEVITNYGGNWNNIYAGGFSAGADALTSLAQQINFQGAIYIAGHLGCSGNTVDEGTFLSIWSGKPVFYYRDTLYGNGGYGYSASYVANCQTYCANYNCSFMAVDMNWGHYSALVDAVFLPNYYMDNKGAYCKDAIESLVYFW